jgi:hypothetical protein
MDEVIRYAELKEFKPSKNIVTDIRFTNLDELTCKFFCNDFDRRKFNSEGRSTLIDDVIDGMADDFLGTELKVDITEEGTGEFIPDGAFVTMHYRGKFLNGE